VQEGDGLADLGAAGFIVPTWTTVPYRCAASTIFRPSHTVWEAGFST